MNATVLNGDNMNIKPLRKNVLLAENREQYKSEAGIIVESNSVANSKTGTVLAIGNEVTMVEVGDKVLVEWNKGKIVTVDGAQRVMISEDDLVAVL